MPLNMYMVASMNIPDRIRQSKKTDRQLSAEIGVSIPVVWRWRRGLVSPNITNIAALAAALDCGVRDLLPEVTA